MFENTLLRFQVEEEDGITEEEDGIMEVEDGITEVEDGITEVEDGIMDKEQLSDAKNMMIAETSGN